MGHAGEKRDGAARLTRREMGVGYCQSELLREPAPYGVATEACSWLKLPHNGGGAVRHHREPYLRQQLGSRQQRVTLVSAEADGMIQPLFGLLELVRLCLARRWAGWGKPESYSSGLRLRSVKKGVSLRNGAPRVP